MNQDQRKSEARRLEDEFFARENARLLEKLRRRTEEEARREALRKVVRIKDEAFLARLMDLGICAETVLALRLIPLVFVAWADGSIDDKERDALMKAARQEGLEGDDTGLQLLSDWLARKPEPHLLELWKEYTSHIWDAFTRDEQEQMRRNLLQSAREVAEAAGGFLGLTSKISAAEQEVLQDLEKALE